MFVLTRLNDKTAKLSNTRHPNANQSSSLKLLNQFTLTALMCKCLYLRRNVPFMSERSPCRKRCRICSGPWVECLLFALFDRKRQYCSEQRHEEAKEHECSVGFGHVAPVCEIGIGSVRTMPQMLIIVPDAASVDEFVVPGA